MQIRTKKPEKKNSFYNTKANGGESLCIVGSPTDKDCNVLSNCVGYACGRFNEIIGSMKYPQLNCNAENFIERAQSLGLTIEETPSVGAIICWQKGGLGSGDGAGHVEVVERVDSASQIFTSASNYAGTAFYNSTRKNTDGNWGIWAGYKFRGFIKNPAITDDKPLDPPDKPGKEDLLPVGSVVNFKGGRVYATSESTSPAVSRPASKCTITVVGKKKALHPYHLISEDGRGVWGWVDAADVATQTVVQLYNVTVHGANAGDAKTIEDLTKKLLLQSSREEIN